MTEVVDLLVTAGAAVRSIEEAAAAGDLGSWLTHDTPVDATDEEFGRHPLRLAARNGRRESVRRLLTLGADPALRDRHGRTPLELCREAADAEASAGRDEVDAILTPLVEPGRGEAN
jgi:ankyrin repeat protein